MIPIRGTLVTCSMPTLVLAMNTDVVSMLVTTFLPSSSERVEGWCQSLLIASLLRSRRLLCSGSWIQTTSSLVKTFFINVLITPLGSVAVFDSGAVESTNADSRRRCRSPLRMARHSLDLTVALCGRVSFVDGRLVDAAIIAQRCFNSKSSFCSAIRDLVEASPAP